MLELEESRGKAVWLKCKGAAVVITALTGLIFGIINHFKEIRDPRVSLSHQELAKKVELVSRDLKNVSSVVEDQQEETRLILKYVLRDKFSTKRSLEDVKARTVIKKFVNNKETKKSSVRLPVRKVESLEQMVQQQKLKER
jgi:hypothetical protein